MFGKRPTESSAADIQALVSEAVQEGLETEFKETLPAKDRDPWLDSQDRIEDRNNECS
jgi:hypothetical protein